MTGISSNVLVGLNYPENRHKYNSIEQIGDLGLEAYATEFKELDLQIGKWRQPDPKMDEYYGWSPYNANLNNPVKYIDPKGDCPGCVDAHHGRVYPQIPNSALLELIQMNKTMYPGAFIKPLK